MNQEWSQEYAHKGMRIRGVRDCHPCDSSSTTVRYELLAPTGEVLDVMDAHRGLFAMTSRFQERHWLFALVTQAVCRAKEAQRVVGSDI